MTEPLRTRGQAAARLADAVVASEGDDSAHAHALSRLRRCCEEAGIDADVLLGEARRRAERRAAQSP